MQAILSFIMLLQILAPVKGWFGAAQPVEVKVKAEQNAQLVLSDFAGKQIDAKKPTDVSGEKNVNVSDLYPDAMKTPGTYVLYVTTKEGGTKDFQGTPLVIGVRRHRGASASVVRVEPLRYALLTAKEGTMKMAFYYDDAPNTAENFLTLAEQGFYDGLTFHRIVPGFVIQGGDPLGDGTGGPGYTINAEFNARPHEPGVLSMARNGDRMEQSGAMPRFEFANSAGSQFFVCLDYSRTKALDRKYTAFGKVVEGMEAVKAIAAAPIEDPDAGRPKVPPVIQKIEVKLVTAKDNPYTGILKPATPAQ